MKIDIPAGMSIWQASEKAKRVAMENYCEVEFEFNKITLYVRPESCADDIAAIYSLKNEIRRLRG